MLERPDFISIYAQCEVLIREENNRSAEPIHIYPVNGQYSVGTKGVCRRCDRNCGPVKITRILDKELGDPNIYGKVVITPQNPPSA